MINEIEIYGQADLDRKCDKGEFPNSICISIGNPHWLFKRAQYDEFIPNSIKQRFPKILRLEFFDETEIANIPPGRPKRLAKKSDIKKVIKFFHGFANQYDKIVIHCWGGIARSPAIGICILYLIYRDQDKVLEIMKSIRPYAVPNKLILKLIDNELGTTFKDRNLEIMKDWKSRIQNRISKK